MRFQVSGFGFQGSTARPYALLAVGCWLLALTACGFEPVLAKRSSTSAVALPAIQISTDRSRLGQLLKAEITDLINPRHDTTPALYRLDIRIKETLVPLFIKPDGTASRGDIRYDTNYTLTRLSDKAVVNHGKITRISSFNSSETADYATFVVQEDAKKRGIIELAKDYALRLGNVDLGNETPASAPLPTP